MNKDQEGTTSAPKKEAKRIAVILIRGLLNLRKPVKDTLKMIRLTRKNHCTILDGNPITLGMLNKIKDYVAWGEIDDATYQELVEKRGEEYSGPETCSKEIIKYRKFFVYNNKKYKKYFRLSPPKKGFGRKGIKAPFKTGGTLGYHGEKINDLIKRML